VATVRSGAFECVADITGWTAGTGSGSIGFSIDETQPPALFDRYGADGSGLMGPDVCHPDDSVPYYSQQVDVSFTVP
ncbi:MAG TPA: hypothetical protein VMH24_08555, partial [Candidatus Sulfotelmatobacter sp.]|nr:hypothetical protein [Candidatus Sulfotelmatobacter sp.]